MKSLLLPLEREHLLTLRNLRANLPHLRGVLPCSLEDQTRWFDSLKNDRNTVMFSIMETNRLLGAAGLTGIDWINRKAEVSIYPDHLEALQELIKYAFGTLNLNMLWGECITQERTDFMVNVGFTFCGSIPEAYWRDEKYVNGEMVALVRG